MTGKSQLSAELSVQIRVLTTYMMTQSDQMMKTGLHHYIVTRQTRMKHHTEIVWQVHLSA